MKTENKALVRILIILSVMLSLIWACQTGNTPEKVGQRATGNAQSEGVSQAPSGLLQVGEVISTGNQLLVVLGWETPVGGDFNPPDAGKKYVAVDVLLANQGENSFSISPLLQMTLKDEQGQKYNVNGKANAATSSSPPSGELNPGERLRGTVGFQVPESANHLYFVYEAKLIGLGEVTVDLGSVPLAVNPPPDLGLEQRQEIFQVGDAVRISDLVVQVMGVTRSPGGSVIKPDPGMTFLIVDVMVENVGERTREITSGLQMYLKDQGDRKYTLHLGAQHFAEAGLPDDELQPGERVRGQIGFMVPEADPKLTFVFDAEIAGYGKVFIALP